MEHHSRRDRISGHETRSRRSAAGAGPCFRLQLRLVHRIRQSPSARNRLLQQALQLRCLFSGRCGRMLLHQSREIASNLTAGFAKEASPVHGLLKQDLGPFCRLGEFLLKISDTEAAT